LEELEAQARAAAEEARREAEERQRQARLDALFDRARREVTAHPRRALKALAEVRREQADYPGLAELEAQATAAELARPRPTDVLKHLGDKRLRWAWLAASLLVAGTAVAIALILGRPTPSPSSSTPTAPLVAAAPEVELTAWPAEIAPGESVTIRWKAGGADSVSLQPFGPVDREGERTDEPGQTLTYTLVATNTRGTTRRAQQVVVGLPAAGPPQATLTLEPGSVVQGCTAELRLEWETQDADAATIEPGVGEVEPAGSRDVPVPVTSTVFTLEAKGPGGTAQAQAELKVEPPRCTVVASSLYLRSGPGTAYGAQTTPLPKGTELAPLRFYAGGVPTPGRATEPGWAEVRAVTTGQVGWAQLRPDRLECNVEPSCLPEGTAAPPTPAASASPTDIGPRADTTPLSVSLTVSPSSPTSGQQVTFKVTASDAGSGLVRVEIWVDGASKKKCTASPCEYTGGPYSAGQHTAQAKAVDKAGNTADSPARPFTVKELIVSIRGTVRYQGRPLPSYTSAAPDLLMNDKKNNEPVLDLVQTYDSKTGEYVIYDLPPGDYSMIVHLDVDGNGYPLPGDFYFWDAVPSPGAQAAQATDVNLSIVMHLTAPADNARSIPDQPPYPVLPGNALFAWDAVAGAAEYWVTIEQVQDEPRVALSTAVDSRTSDTRYGASLPPLAGNQHYEFSVWALDGTGGRVGLLMVRKPDSGFSWDYRFKVQ
jgi:hypothetical protein